MNLTNYMEQHKNIQEEIDFIKSNLNNQDIINNSSEIARHISMLAGRMKIHLSSEDKYLYPKLMESQDDSAKRMAYEYQTEMGGLIEVFHVYKEKYNTRSKILEHSDTFLNETKQVISKIEERINKEENGIYKHVS